MRAATQRARETRCGFVEHRVVELLAFGQLAEMFSRLNGFSATMGFTPDAKKLWIHYQHDKAGRKGEVDPLNDAEGSRLCSEPTQTLKIALLSDR